LLTKKPQNVFHTLLIIIVLLNVLHVAGGLYVWMTNVEPTPALVSLFHLDSEYNVPTLFSAMLLLISAGLLIIIARSSKNKPFYFHWGTLACLFVFLAMDEAFLIHETLIPIFRDLFHTSGILRFAWVIPYGFAIIFLVLLYSSFIFKLPKPTRSWFILSGLLYVSGALLFELVSGYFYELYGGRSLFYQLVMFIEENLEMLGLSTFIFTLTSYIDQHAKTSSTPITSS
jgi:hypothetical protein